MRDLGLCLLIAVGLMGPVMGFGYIRRTSFMPYQATVTGKTWSQIDVGVQTIILGMLRIIGGTFASLGASILCLCYALYQGERWAPWAILIIAALALGPALYVSLMLRKFQPKAKPPVRQTLIAIAFVILGVSFSLYATGS